MISDVLKKHIPSKSYVEYLEKMDHSFTDYEEAGILVHVIKDVSLKHEELGNIADRTEDERLKQQINDYLEFEKERIEHFCDNSDGNCIYVVQTYDEECFEDVVLAYTNSYRTAVAIGRKEKIPFTVRKEAVLNEVPDAKAISKSFFNPYILEGDDADLEDYAVIIESDDYTACEGTFFYNCDGVLEDYYSGWICNISDQEDVERKYSSDLFYNAFIDLPFPFEKGDFVRYVSNSKRNEYGRDDILVGIVDTSGERWEELREKSMEMFLDVSDASVTVQFLQRDGDFSHNHISPLNLEKAEINEDLPWYELAFMGQGLVMGDADIGFFTSIQKHYKDYLAWKKQRASREILESDE